MAATAVTSGPSTSYAPMAAGTLADEVARLHGQLERTWAVERRRLAGLGLPDGQRLLEAGCGPGLVTVRLAQWLPRLQIVAIDSDPEMLDLAHTTLAEAGVAGRVELRLADVQAPGLPDASVDVVLSRYLFQHLADPVSAAAALRATLRPGGLHVAIDVDDGLWGLAQPRMPEFEGWHLQRARAQASRGGDRFCGRRLARILAAAGHVGTGLDVYAYDSDALGLPAFDSQIGPDQFLPLLDAGTMTLAEYLRARRLHERFRADPQAFVLALGFMGWGRAPGGHLDAR